jgi:hypothetical protein
MWHVLTTVARQTPRDMFSMWSDPSLLRNNGKAAFSAVCSKATMGRLCFLCGPIPGYITWILWPQTVSCQLALSRQSGKFVVKVNGSYGVGREATGEDTAWTLGTCYNEL